MMSYYVIERLPCEYCDGTGTATESEWDGECQVPIPAKCEYCNGSGTITREVPLAEALAAFEHTVDEGE